VQMTRFPLAVGFATVLTAGLVAPTAAADDKIVLGGGAGIIVDGSYCTLTTIGHDNTGAVVGFTAAHCGGPGADVVAEGANNGAVGSVVAANGDLDYAVIKFDPAKVMPTANFAGFAINGIGPDPDFRQPACTQGAATGNHCGGIGTIPGPGPHRAMGAPFQPGDDGRPVTSDNMLIGLVYGVVNAPGNLIGAPPASITYMDKFSAIMNDVNAKGGPGAGFTPI
jgi:hypothetical protein